MTKAYARLMEHTLAYRVWQAPFAEKKLAPLYAHTDVARARRVLDVGCGPGTNTAHFLHAGYLGIDFNPAYIESARRRHGREFVVADVTKYEVAPEERFDLILANSLFHHIDTASTRKILAHLATFEPVVVEPYPLGAAGVTLWNMIYFKGRARR